MNGRSCSPLRLAAAAILCGPLLYGCGQGRPAIDPAVDWPEFRGPYGVGISDAVDPPIRWSADSPNIRWQVEVPGMGHSSPIAARGRVFVTTAVPLDEPGKKPIRGALRQFSWDVIAIDLETGERLWQTRVFRGMIGNRHRFNPGAAPTPATDGELVYAYFGPVLAALDWKGEVLWQTEVEEAYLEHTSYGSASSLVLTESAIVVFQDREDSEQEEPGWIGAFDKRTGELLWRDEWMHTCCSYATPLVVELPAGRQLIRYDSLEVVAYDPETGERLWEQAHESTQTVPTPVAEGGLLALTGSMHTREVVVLRLAEAGGKAPPELLWRKRRAPPKLVSPILLDGLLFTLSGEGVATCYEAESGKVRWQKRLEGADFVSSMVAADGMVYATGEGGRTSVFAAAPEFRLIADNDLVAPVMASPAIAGGCFLIRTYTELVCIGKEEPEQAA